MQTLVRVVSEQAWAVANGYLGLHFQNVLVPAAAAAGVRPQEQAAAGGPLQEQVTAGLEILRICCSRKNLKMPSINVSY